MTREQIIEKLAKRVQQDLYSYSTWSDLVASVQAFTPQHKRVFMKAILAHNRQQVGGMLIDALIQYKKQEAKSVAIAKVNSDLNNDSLSLSELEKYL